MGSELLKNILLEAKTWAGVDFGRANELAYEVASDRRYKLKSLAHTNNSGIFTYRGYKFYYHILNQTVTLETI